jgi:hypothetical protein
MINYFINLIKEDYKSSNVTIGDYAAHVLFDWFNCSILNDNTIGYCINKYNDTYATSDKYLILTTIRLKCNLFQTQSGYSLILKNNNKNITIYFTSDILN